MLQTGPPARPVLPVVAWMTGALACFIVAAIAVRALSHYTNVFQIGLARTGIGLVLLLVSLAVWPPLRSQVTAADPLSHVLRNAIHAVGGVLWTAAIATLPFATVFSLEFTAPAWVALLAYPLLGERVRYRAIVGIGTCTAGVLIILRPGLTAWDPNLVSALAAAFCFGVSVVLTRKLALKQPTFSILLWMMVLQSAFYAVIVLLMEAPLPAALGGEGLAAIPLLGLAGLGSQLCLARALSFGEAAMVIPLDFLRVPLIALIGLGFYGEAISLWVLSGAALILAGICYGLMPQRTGRAGPASARVHRQDAESSRFRQPGAVDTVTEPAN